MARLKPDGRAWAVARRSLVLVLATWLVLSAGVAQARQHKKHRNDEPAAEQACTAPETASYSGPIFDAMAQTDQGLDEEATIAAARSVGVACMALFARVYKHQDGRGLVNRMAAAHPDFVVVGAPKLFDMRGDLGSSYVEEVLSGVAAHRYAFIGEILYTHGDKTSGEITATGERYIDPLRPLTARLIERLKGRHVPIMAHWEVYDWSRDRPKFDTLYATYPDQIFIWPHLGFGTAAQVAAVLEAHPNVWGTVSKRERANDIFVDAQKAGAIGGAAVDPCGNVLPEWRRLMERFSDRLMFATDAHRSERWDHYTKIVARWRMILGQLPPNVAKAIAYDNAARLYSPQ